MKTKTLSVRLDDDVASGLDEIEHTTGIDRSQFVRGVVKALVDYFNQKKEIRLPFVLMSQAEWDAHRSEVQTLLHKLDPHGENHSQDD